MSELLFWKVATRSIINLIKATGFYCIFKILVFTLISIIISTILDTIILNSTDVPLIKAVGSAAIVASRLCKKRLPNNSSIFSAEARGMLLALDMIQRSTGSQFLFLSNSLSCL